MSVFDRIKLIKGDITQCEVEAIVNAANQTLLGGGGVDGAIHRAAGSALLKECEALGGCRVGEAKITKGYRLKATYIIHTVGPKWEDGNGQEYILLAECYRNCFRLAEKYKIMTIAFPAISTGAYLFPKDKAASIAVREVKNFLEENMSMKMVYFICYDEENHMEYKKLITAQES